MLTLYIYMLYVMSYKQSALSLKYTSREVKNQVGLVVLSGKLGVSRACPCG